MVRTDLIGKTWTGATIMILVLVFVMPARAQENSVCLKCHATEGLKLERNGREVSWFVDGKRLAQSMHAELDCTDCHETISLQKDKWDATSSTAHGDSVEPVRCGECHEEEHESYQRHGRLQVGADPDLPSCASCHGKHEIVASSDPRSPVYPTNLPETCRTCHTDVDLLKKHEYLRQEPIKLYEGSVHGRASKNGLSAAPTCNDCHSAIDQEGHRTAHRILDSSDPESTIHHFTIPNTCGQCHKQITQEYWDGIHGQLVKRGEMDAPVCTHCHGEHGILPVSDLRSPVSAARLAEATCAPCHESVALNERYGVPGGELKSYVDSYHGHKKKAGEVHVANCASCHGSHKILSHSDSRSSIHPSNLQNTCGACHPGISDVLAQTPIHDRGAESDNGWPRFFTVLYMWLIGLTIGLMLLHNMAHWLRHVKLRSKVKQVVRLTAGEVAQHWLLMTSFIVLVISGFSLRFSDAWWVQILFGWGGGTGFVIRGTVHRVAAVVFMIWAVWHVLYLCTRRGRCWLRDMMASKRDLQQIKDNVLFFLGRSRAQPRFGRFSYMEKSEYWALMWGGVVMAGTGVLLWFENYFVEEWNLGKVVLDVSQVIHYYEAWLATLAILVWHMYATVFSPSVYPMNPAWWAGKMPQDMYDEEHPEGPRQSVATSGPRANETNENAESGTEASEKTNRDPKTRP